MWREGKRGWYGRKQEIDGEREKEKKTERKGNEHK